MAKAFPYCYVSCPCSDVPRQGWQSHRTSHDAGRNALDVDEDEKFEPGNARSKFSLFPLEHLLYCEECHEIKCPRCVTEEIISTYCPSCLFEVPSSSIKPDYNRCSRNCFSCPICTSQLITTSVGDKSEGPWILSCNHCLWSTLDIGIQFDRPQGLRQQIDRRANGGRDKVSYREISGAISGIRSFIAKQADQKGQDFRSVASAEREKEPIAGPELASDPYARFEALKAFYKEQLSATNPFTGGGPGLDAYSSPSSLSRIMSLYNNGGGPSHKKLKQQIEPVREARTLSEGLLDSSDLATTTNPQPMEYIDTPTSQQLLTQHPLPVGNPQAQHVAQLRPMPTLLRTKRSKRCTTCKHILVKPEFKVTSTRYRIKLVALNYIPFITLKPVPISGGLQAPGPDGANIILEPGKPSQWIVTLRNPLFENLTVTLGSPSTTPGKHGHKVTILCPEFTIGKSGDVWDDALNNMSNNNTSTRTMTSTTPSTSTTPTTNKTTEQIAGKIYDRGRNWTSIVIEVIPSHILKPASARETQTELDEDEDEDGVEIPIRVRLVWAVSEEDDAHDGKQQAERIRRRNANATTIADIHADAAADVDADDGKRELSYWLVLGIGRVRR